MNAVGKSTQYVIGSPWKHSRPLLIGQKQNPPVRRPRNVASSESDGRQMVLRSFFSRPLVGFGDPAGHSRSTSGHWVVPTYHNGVARATGFRVARCPLLEQANSGGD